MSLFRGMWKNLKVFFRTKSSAAVVLLSPILIVALVGVALYANTGQDYPLGVVSANGESIDDMIDLSMFSVTEYSSVDDCSDMLLMGSAAACVEVTKRKGAKDVSLLVDESREEVSILLQDRLREEISAQSEQERRDIQEDRLGSIQGVYDDLSSIKSTLETVERRLGDVESDVSSASSSAEGIDFSVDIESDDVSNEINDFIDIVELLEEDFEAFISDAKSFLNESNLNESEKEDFEDDIDSAESNLGDGLEDDIDDILDELDNLRDDLEDAEDDAVQTNTLRDELIEDLEDILDDIDGVISSVESSIDSSEDALITLETLGASSAEELASPITFSTDTVSSTPEEYLQTAPTLISIAVFLFSGLLGGVFVFNGRMGPSAVRERSLPLSSFTRFSINFFTSIFLGAIQFGLLVLGLFALSNFELGFSVEGLLVFGGIGILISVAIGAILGSLFNSIEGVSLSILSINALFLFFSRTFFPIDTLGVIGEYTTLINPLTLVSEGMRRTVLLDIPLYSLEFSLYILGGIVLVLMTISYLLHIKDERDRSKAQPQWVIDVRLAIQSAKTPMELRDVVMDLPYYKYLRVRKYVEKWLYERDFDEAAKYSWSRKKLFD